ncbi:MAG: hypothetical protein ACLR56_14435 [Oscillospiraceae bacterium]
MADTEFGAVRYSPRADEKYPEKRRYTDLMKCLKRKKQTFPIYVFPPGFMWIYEGNGKGH